MPGGGITGDGSVKWFIDMYDAEKGFTRVDAQKGSRGRALHLEGLDKFNGPRFVITIKHPRGKDRDEREDFIDQLEKQWRKAKAGAMETKLTIPIEYKGRGATYRLNDYQITVRWD